MGDVSNIKGRATRAGHDAREMHAKVTELEEEQEALMDMVQRHYRLQQVSPLSLTEDDNKFLRWMYERAEAISTRLMILPSMIETYGDGALANWNRLSALQAEAAKSKKNKETLKKDHLKQVNIFADFGGDFVFWRSPEHYAQAIWQSVLIWDRLSITPLIENIRMYAWALEFLADATPETSTLKGYYYKESAKADKWVSELERESDKGISRKRLYELLIARVPEDSPLHIEVTKVMDKMKLEFATEWGDKIYPRGTTTTTTKKKPSVIEIKDDEPRAGGSGLAKRETVAGYFAYKNFKDYKARGGRTLIPSFPRPAKLSDHLKEWCMIDGYADHPTRDCPDRGTRGRQNRGRQRSRSREDRRSPRREGDARKEKERKAAKKDEK